MANEITINARLRCVNGGFELDRRVVNVRQDQSAEGMVAGVQEIATAHEAIAMGDVSAAGYAIIRNLDATNFIEVGVDVSGTFYPFLKIRPYAVALLPLGTSAPYARADTAAAKLEYRILAD